MPLVKNRSSHERKEVVKFEYLQKAVFRLRVIMDEKEKRLPESDEKNTFAFVQAKKETYNRSNLLFEIGDCSLKEGRVAIVPKRIATYESVLALINSVETWSYRDDLLKVHEAAQDVFALLAELVEQPSTL